jgi:hypothetical protein
MPDTAPIEERTEAIHGFFGLSYSTYLVLHRSLLQSMPDEWQNEFVALLNQLHAAFRHVEQTECYEVVPGTEHTIGEMSTAELRAAGISSSQDAMTDEEIEDDGKIAYYQERTGRELDEHERVVLPCAEQLPGYQRGRTRIDVDMDAYLAERAAVSAPSPTGGMNP